MTPERIAGICFCIVITSAVATGQQRSEQRPSSGQPRVSLSALIPPATSPTGDACKHEANPAAGKSSSKPPNCQTLKASRRQFKKPLWRRPAQRPIPRRPDMTCLDSPRTGDEGCWRRLNRCGKPRQTETPAPFTTPGHRTSMAVFGLMSRQTEQTRSTAPDVRQTDTTLLVPRFNETLQETERTEYTERRINPGVVRARQHAPGSRHQRAMATNRDTTRRSSGDRSVGTHRGRHDSTSGHKREAGGR